MAEKGQGSGEPLDIQKVHYLVRLMKRYDLTELNINDGRVRIRLSRKGPEPVPAGPPAVSIPAAWPAAHVDSETPPAPAARAETPASSGVLIKSPMVGTYYSSNAPDAPSFVSVGSVVRPDTTVCIIEAMKVFTDIPAGVSGKIAEILVKSGQAVEFDQPLFRVAPG